jgi:hypothetical protein
MFEMWFPPGFINVMTHLLVHLVKDLEICGPVGARWCYPIERHLCVLKRYVRNKAKPKGSMAMGYMYDEALGFCMEYFSLYEHTRRRRVWDFSTKIVAKFRPQLTSTHQRTMKDE